MKFHLNFTPASCGFKINHNNRLFLIGSCFSDHMGQLLQAHKFQTTVNPNGVLFNPRSIQKAITQAINSEAPSPDALIEHDEHVFSYLHHSKIKAKHKDELLLIIKQLNAANLEALKNSDFLFITLGSAYHYYHSGLMSTVANCHKQNQTLFEKQLMLPQEIVNDYKLMIDALKQINPKLHVIFTVSPVKHLKDGVVENNLSKASLLLAAHQLVKEYQHCHYFPAYELVNDDLRDYRFYKADLAHPSQQAVDYVWQKFSDCFFDENTKKINHEIQKLNTYLNHNSLHANENSDHKHTAYIAKQKSLIQQLNPVIQF